MFLFKFTSVTSFYLLLDPFGPERNRSQVNCLDVTLPRRVNAVHLVQQRAFWDTSLEPQCLLQAHRGTASVNSVGSEAAKK